MNQLKNKKYQWVKTILTGALFSLFLLPSFVWAAAEPTVLSLSTLKSEVSIGDEVDFIVAYGNTSGDTAKDVELSINYNENQLEDISLGNPTDCKLGNVVIRCVFKELPGNTSRTVGFTAKVKTDIPASDRTIRTTATIAEVGNNSDNINNNSQENILNIIGLSASGVNQKAGLLSLSSLQQSNAGLAEPASSQGLAIFDVTQDPDWKTHSLSTMGLKFMIRGKEALAWTLGINNAGFDSPAIETHYLKVLTVVNSLFIIGLLIIAGMWMFSLLIPRRYLRNVILIYGLAVLLVNFAFPANRLLIQGANLLQKTFMNGVSITDVVQTPAYDDKKAIGYLNEKEVIAEADKKTLSLSLAKEEGNKPKPPEVVVGQLKQEFLTPTQTGTLNLGKESGTIQLQSTGKAVSLSLNSEQAIELNGESRFNPAQEQSIFIFLLMVATGFAYLGMALIFILRIVILWALLIVSPALLLLAIFRATRSYFVGWISLYTKWLLMGPLIALGLALMVGLWKGIGLPITSAYPGTGQFGLMTNIGFYLPGKTTVNTLSTTAQMMEYVIFLTMLYLPILFALMLTRQKMWSSAVSVITENTPFRSSAGTGTPAEKETIKTESKTAVPASQKSVITDLLSGKWSSLSSSALPASMKGFSPRTTGQAKASWSPGQLKTLPLSDLLKSALEGGRNSRHAHEKTLADLANPQRITDPARQQKLVNIREEIESRANQGQPEATQLMGEIKSQTSVTANVQAATEPAVTGPAPVFSPSVELHASAPEKEDHPSAAQSEGLSTVKTTPHPPANAKEQGEEEDADEAEKSKEENKKEAESEDHSDNSETTDQNNDQPNPSHH